MAWNGRNESIFGGKAAAPADPNPAPSKDVGSINKPAEAAVSEPKKTVISPPAPSVWNGRHMKIIGSSAPSKEINSPVVALESVPARSPSPAGTVSLSTASSGISNKKELNVVSSPPKGDTKTPQLKEDETTNSTAGSSTTNITVDDEPSATFEGNVVTTVNTASSESDKTDGSKELAASDEKKKTATARSTNHSANNRHQNYQQAKNASDGGNAASRRSGNHNKAGQRSNNHSLGKNNYSRNVSGGGVSRRRVHNVDKPLCAFFARGMCNRGTSCAFRHDPKAAAAAVAAGMVAPPSNPAFSRSNPKDTNGISQSMNGVSPIATPFVPIKRAFDPNKARAIQLAKEAQDQEDRSRYASTAKIISDEKKTEDDVVAAVAVEAEAFEEDPPIFSIDVECIATGYGSCAKGINDGCGNESRTKEGVPAGQYNDGSHRYPGRVAMVDTDGNVVADVVIRPPNDGAGVVSYLTPLTGLTKEMCLGDDAKSLEEAVGVIKGLLPKNGVLVGQAIDHDVEWLGLTDGGEDFDRMVDISDIFRQRMPAVLGQAAAVLKKKEEGDVEEEQPASDDKSSDEYLGFATRYRHFSLRHVSINLLGDDIQSGVHNPITDAKYSLMLFHKYRNSSKTQLRIVRDGLHRAPITPGFAAENTPVIDGVCVSAAGYHYKRAARKIWRWYSATTKTKEQQS